MDLSLARDAFLKALQMVQNIVEPRQTVPVLSNVLLEADGDHARLAATDLEVAARVSLPARVGTPGSVTLSARKLGEILKELPAEALTLKVGENSAVSIRCAGANYRVVGLPATDFPAVVPSTPPAWLTVEGGMLRDMLTQTTFAISHDESRFALGGVLFVFQPGELRLVATDGHRLALATRTVGQGLSGISGIVPRKAVSEIARVLGGSEDVQIAIHENQFVLQMPNFVMMARLIEGQFPNYEAVIPRTHPERLALPRSVLVPALRRVSVMAEERNRPIKFALADGALTLSAASHDLGEAEESIAVEYAGQPVSIGFNARYLLDALAPLDKDDMVLELKDAQSPAVVRGAEGSGYACVIMPMRIQ